LSRFSECTRIGNVVKVRWKSVSGSWTGVEEATFSSSCSWQNISSWASRLQSVSATNKQNWPLSSQVIRHCWVMWSTVVCFWIMNVEFTQKLTTAMQCFSSMEKVFMGRN